ncbi:MAG: hypothetical protein KAJ60_02245, partial [Desulfobulbaceae bacterium]|nr:hypothetical protein [Desulfobulbaceae bacterium]
ETCVSGTECSRTIPLKVEDPRLVGTEGLMPVIEPFFPSVPSAFVPIFYTYTSHPAEAWAASSKKQVIIVNNIFPSI